MLDILFIIFGLIIGIYMAIVVISYALILIVASLKLIKRGGLDLRDSYKDLASMHFAKPISIIVPAYNESSGILNSVYSLLNLRYSNFEVIIVNDGSKDDTLDKAIEEFQMEAVFQAVRIQIPSKENKQIYRSKTQPNLYLLDKENGGKADALNAGINLAHYPYICSIDGDSILHKNALLRIMEPIIESNGQVVAAGGTIRIANEMNVDLGDYKEAEFYSKPLILIQAVEYIRSFLIGRIALSHFNSLLIISGAFSVFERQWVIDAGGYSTDMIGEDMELVVKIQRLIKERKADKRVVSIADPICYTEAPQSLAVLGRQRRRWHQGLWSSLLRHRDMLFNPKYGVIGMLSLPYYWIVEAVGPVIEFASVIYIILSFFYGKAYFEFMLSLSVVFLLYGAIYTLGSVILDALMTQVYPSMRSTFRLLIISITEVIWYRPLSVVWRLQGIFRTFKGSTDWGVMDRVGLGKEGVK